MLKILIVDDSPIIRLYMNDMLSRYGSCSQAVDGSQAVVTFTEALDAGNPFDLVVMDIMMPEMDGLTAVRRITELENQRGLELDHRAKIVMLSCLSDGKYMIEAQMRCGAHAYLTKPSAEKTVVETLIGLDLLANPLDGLPDAFAERV